jgi:hypothetical protein
VCQPYGSNRIWLNRGLFIGRVKGAGRRLPNFLQTWNWSLAELGTPAAKKAEQHPCRSADSIGQSRDRITKQRHITSCRCHLLPWLSERGTFAIPSTLASVATTIIDRPILGDATNRRFTPIVKKLPFLDHAGDRLWHHLFPRWITVADLSQDVSGEDAETFRCEIIEIVDAASQ